MEIFGSESAVTILVETVLMAKHMEESGEIETTEQDDVYDFSARCAEIAEKAYLAERCAYSHTDESDGWNVIYEVIEDEIMRAWGEHKGTKRWLFWTGKADRVVLTKHGEDDYELYEADTDFRLCGTMESILAELTDDCLIRSIKYELRDEEE